MDISLFSKIVYQLLLDKDEVGLPGLGTFKAELVGASFSDKGFTLNPPYRKINFSVEEGDDDSLVQFYARENKIEISDARNIVNDFMAAFKQELLELRAIELPELGKFKVTMDGTIFFVCSPDLNIYPYGFGLEPVSLKNTSSVELPDLEAVQPQKDDAPLDIMIQEPEPEPEPEPDPQKEPEKPFTPLPGQLEEEHYPEYISIEEATIPYPHKTRKAIITILIIILALAVVFFGALKLMGMWCPEILDLVLYSPEEYDLIYR